MIPGIDQKVFVLFSGLGFGIIFGMHFSLLYIWGNCRFWAPKKFLLSPYVDVLTFDTRPLFPSAEHCLMIDSMGM